MAGGAAIVVVNRMAQSAADRRKDSLIGKKEVYHTRRFHQQAQDDETRWTFLEGETTNEREHSNMAEIATTLDSELTRMSNAS